MSLVKKAIQSLVQTGKIVHEFNIGDVKFVMEPLDSEEQILADGLVDIDHLKEKYNTEKRVSTYPDMIGKYRSISQVAFAIRKVNGEDTIDKSLSAKEQFKQFLEFRDDLGKLSTSMIDQLVSEYRKLNKKQIEFFDDFEDNVGKF